jgi:hypothetical protein
MGRKCFLSAHRPSIHPSCMVHWWGRGERGGEGRELIFESGSFFEEF